MAEWSLVVERPLAFGMWEFGITGPPGTEPKTLTWGPGDDHLMAGVRPFLAAPVAGQTATAARRAARGLVDRLNEEPE